MLLILSSSYWYENWGLGSLRNILKLTLLVRWCYPFHCTLLPPGFYFLPASSPRVWTYVQFLHMDMERFPKPVTTWEWILCIDFGLPRAMSMFSRKNLRLSCLSSPGICSRPHLDKTGQILEPLACFPRETRYHSFPWQHSISEHLVPPNHVCSSHIISL